MNDQDRTAELKTPNLFPSGKRKGRPSQFSEEEKREKRRIKSQKYRDKNPDRSREITRMSMQRKSHEKALAEGRTPGKIGRPAVWTEEEKKEIRKLKARRYYRENRSKESKKAAKREREKRRSKKEGTYDKKPLKRLTVEERRARGVRDFHKRRAKISEVGGSFTLADIADLMEKQKGKCSWCLVPFGGRKPHVDHYMPLVLGGSNDKTNLRLLHQTCNLKKGKSHPLEFAKRNGLLCW